MYLLGLLHWSLSHNHLPSNCYITFGQPSQSLPKSLFGKRSKFVLVSHRTTPRSSRRTRKKVTFRLLRLINVSTPSNTYYCQIIDSFSTR